jgi:peptidoglycan/xylan/chitin deacetylase (PgdA/CDA1 family)
MLLLAGFCLVQATGMSGTSPAAVLASTPSRPALGNPLPPAASARAEWEIFPTRHDLIPVGRSSIYLPILMYHYVRTVAIGQDLLGFRLSVTPADFQAQMDALAAGSYHPVDFADVRAYFGGSRPLPKRPVVITLDDGYQDLFTTAFPILQAHHFKAVAYIVSGFVGRAAYVNSDEIVQMDRAGIQIAAHTVDHPNLARSSIGSIMHQLVDSKAWLERLVGHPVLDMAYPSGQFNAQVIGAVQLAGYDTAVTEQSSTLHSVGGRYAWARTRVGGGEALSDFLGSLGPAEPCTTVTEGADQTDVDAPALPRAFQLLPPAVAGQTEHKGFPKPPG